MIMFFYYLTLSVLVYLFVVFVGIRLFVPYYGFKETEISNNIPEYFLKDIEEINKISRSNPDFVKRSYDYITDRYYGSRFGFLLTARYALWDTFGKKSGLLPCNTMNQLLRIMLVKSGRFTNSDVKTQVVFLNFFIHQYLRVRVEGEWVSVDPTFKALGIPFGKHAIWFV